MLYFCEQHQIIADIELIGIQQVNKGYEHMLKSDVIIDLYWIWHHFKKACYTKLIDKKW